MLLPSTCWCHCLFWSIRLGERSHRVRWLISSVICLLMWGKQSSWVSVKWCRVTKKSFCLFPPNQTGYSFMTHGRLRLSKARNYLWGSDSISVSNYIIDLFVCVCVCVVEAFSDFDSMKYLWKEILIWYWIPMLFRCWMCLEGEGK